MLPSALTPMTPGTSVGHDRAGVRDVAEHRGRVVRAGGVLRGMREVIGLVALAATTTSPCCIAYLIARCSAD